MKVHVDKDRLWFTSDLHFFHTNIIKYCNRPWNSVEKMNEGIVKNWNSVVNHDDTAFILGDVSMGGISKAPYLAEFLSQMNGNIYLVPGNHDTWILRAQECLKHITVLPPLFELKVPDEDVRKGYQRIVLCHYAMKVWNGSHKGNWHLYGHSHHTMPTDYSMKAFDVGIDGPGYNYKPLSYGQVKSLMSLHSIGQVDHHNENTN